MNASPSFAGLFFITAIVGMFLVLATVVVASVLVASRGRDIHWGKIALAGLSLIVLVPVVCIVAVIGYASMSRWRAIHRPAETAAIAVRVDDMPGGRDISLGPLTQKTTVSPMSSPIHSPSGTTLQAEAPIDPPVTAERPPVEEPEVSVPDWVKDKSLLSDNQRLVVLSSQQYATIVEADADILRQARSLVQQELRAAYHYNGVPPVPQGLLDRFFGRRHVEEITRQAGANTFRVYRVHRQLELSKSLIQKLEPLWRNQNGQQRLWVLVTLAGFFTLVVATLAAYLRLDTRTGSAYRGRLRFAAVCAIMAGGVVAASVLA